MKTVIKNRCKEPIKVVIRDKDECLSSLTSANLSSRLSTALGRFSGRIREAHLSLYGGRDVRSRVAICLEKWNVMIVEAQHRSALVAASRAIEKAQRGMARSVRRRRRAAQATGVGV